MILVKVIPFVVRKSVAVSAIKKKLELTKRRQADQMLAGETAQQGKHFYSTLGLVLLPFDFKACCPGILLGVFLQYGPRPAHVGSH